MPQGGLWKRVTPRGNSEEGMGEALSWLYKVNRSLPEGKR